MGFRHSSIMDSGYRASVFEADHNIADVIEIVVTTPAKGSYWLADDVVSHQTVNVTLTEGVTIATAGEAMVFYARNRQGDWPDDCACLIERDDVDSSYTGGTEILTKVELRAEGGNHTLMKQSTSYLITVTSKADNNYTSVLVCVWEGSGTVM